MPRLIRGCRATADTQGKALRHNEHTMSMKPVQEQKCRITPPLSREGQTLAHDRSLLASLAQLAAQLPHTTASKAHLDMLVNVEGMLERVPVTASTHPLILLQPQSCVTAGAHWQAGGRHIFWTHSLSSLYWGVSFMHSAARSCQTM